MTIATPLAIAACDSVNAQSIETITNQPKTQIKVGGEAEAIAVNEDTNKIYVYNPTNGTVSLIDNTGDTAKTIRVGKYTSGAPLRPGSNPIAVDDSDNKIYVANAGSNTVSVIDGTNDTVIARITVGNSPSSIAVDYGVNLTKIYVANSGSHTVSVIDSSNDTKERRDIVVGKDPVYIAIGGDIRHEIHEIYVANYGSHSVSVINASNNVNKKNITVGTGPSTMLYEHGNKIYVANYGSHSVSVINASTYTTKTIFVGANASSMTFAGDRKIYVANYGSHSVSVINPRNDTNEQNITTGINPSGMAGDFYSHKIYVTSPYTNTVSVIDGSNRSDVRDKKEPHDIIVGQDPRHISFNSHTHMIYVGNSGSHTVSVINGFSSKVAAGVTFNVSPGNSGTIICGSKEYPTNIYLYVDNGTRCAGQPNNNFRFDGWVEILASNRNSTIPIGDSSGNLTVNRYGTFTANFKPIPPADPTQFLFPLYGIIASSLFGWSIPSIMGRVKARTQRKYLKECMNQIGKLDRNTIVEMITEYYVDGKISESHRQLLKDKISELYNNPSGSYGSPIK